MFKSVHCLEADIQIHLMLDEMELKPLLIRLPGEDPVFGQMGLESFGFRSWLGFCVGFWV